MLSSIPGSSNKKSYNYNFCYWRTYVKYNVLNLQLLVTWWAFVLELRIASHPIPSDTISSAVTRVFIFFNANQFRFLRFKFWRKRGGNLRWFRVSWQCRSAALLQCSSADVPQCLLKQKHDWIKLNSSSQYAQFKNGIYFLRLLQLNVSIQRAILILDETWG